MIINMFIDLVIEGGIVGTEAKTDQARAEIDLNLKTETEENGNPEKIDLLVIPTLTNVLRTDLKWLQSDSLTPSQAILLRTVLMRLSDPEVPTRLL
jgi:hypothetical protein